MSYSYEIEARPKSLRETLCLAQNLVVHRSTDVGRSKSDVAILQQLIDACDKMRPLGTNGKHGTLHTQNCGCDDK